MIDWVGLSFFLGGARRATQGNLSHASRGGESAGLAVRENRSRRPQNRSPEASGAGVAARGWVVCIGRHRKLSSDIETSCLHYPAPFSRPDTMGDGMGEKPSSRTTGAAAARRRSPSLGAALLASSLIAMYALALGAQFRMMGILVGTHASSRSSAGGHHVTAVVLGKNPPSSSSSSGGSTAGGEKKTGWGWGGGRGRSPVRRRWRASRRRGAVASASGGGGSRGERRRDVRGRGRRPPRIRRGRRRRPRRWRSRSRKGGT